MLGTAVSCEKSRSAGQTSTIDITDWQPRGSRSGLCLRLGPNRAGVCDRPMQALQQTLPVAVVLLATRPSTLGAVQVLQHSSDGTTR